MAGDLVHAPATLPDLVRRAADQLALATSAAEVLEARDLARVGYDAAKSAARMARAKGAHDELIAKVHRTQADALEIEAAAKRRLADEYDAAQERGEVAQSGRPKSVQDGNDIPTAADLGLSRKDIHEARQIRNAEEADPGIVNRTVSERLAAGHEPTRAAVREAILEAVSKPQPVPANSRRNPDYVEDAKFADAAALVDHAKEIVAIFERQGVNALDGLPGDAARARAVPHLDKAREALISIGWRLRHPDMENAA